MSRPSSQYPILTLAAGIMSTVVLSSCQLPPQEAWRDIREEGLIPFIADSWNGNLPHHGESPGYLTPPPPPQAPSATAIAQNRQPATTAPSVSEPPHSVVTTTPSSSSPTTAPLPSADTSKVLTAQIVPSLPGFVRSPYTNPPRLVDVKGTTPGATMVCPYTHRPFIIPSDYQNPPSNSALASEDSDRNGPPSPTSSPINPDKLPQANLTNRSGGQTTVIEPHNSTPSVAANNHPASSSNNKPSNTTAQNTPSSTPAPAAAPKPNVQDIPYGTPIAGRPGLVYSPYADKNKVVDVTGLPVGMEVKCPYTGKLFRVPPQDMALTKPADQPQNLAAPTPEPKK